MLLSEMFGVERDVEFEVIGYIGRFILKERSDGTERLLWRLKDIYVNADLDILYDIIRKAPANIIHLPPPMTDEQKEQLRALYTLGYKWLTKDRSGKAHAYAQRSPSKQHPSAWGNGGLECIRILNDLPSGVLASLVSWNDNFPFDIGKALGVE